MYKYVDACLSICIIKDYFAKKKIHDRNWGGVARVNLHQG